VDFAIKDRKNVLKVIVENTPLQAALAYAKLKILPTVPIASTCVAIKTSLVTAGVGLRQDFTPQLPGALLNAFNTNNRINQYLIDNIPQAAWNAKPPGGKGRSIPAIMAHMHNTLTPDGTTQRSLPSSLNANEGFRQRQAVVTIRSLPLAVLTLARSSSSEILVCQLCANTTKSGYTHRHAGIIDYARMLINRHGSELRHTSGNKRFET